MCPVCKNPFTVIKCRENVAKYCSYNCRGIGKRGLPTWNKGKSYDELYSPSEADRIKSIQHIHSIGENNPMYGKHHAESSKRIMSEKKNGYTPWITGKKLPGIFKHLNRLGEHNAYIKYILKKEGISFDEYRARLTDKEKYYREVIRITRLQNITILEHYDKRAKAPTEHAYHLDHIYPVIGGFENNIAPEIIGDISNLRFIPWKENLKKSDKILFEIKKELYENRIPNRDPI